MRSASSVMSSPLVDALDDRPEAPFGRDQRLGLGVEPPTRVGVAERPLPQHRRPVRGDHRVGGGDAEVERDLEERHAVQLEERVPARVQPALCQCANSACCAMIARTPGQIARRSW
jgi:hypothetical protein